MPVHADLVLMWAAMSLLMMMPTVLRPARRLARGSAPRALTFITGYYGMNFDTGSPWNMPLLRFRYGGLVAVAMMAATTIGMVVLFWRRGWLKRWH